MFANRRATAVPVKTQPLTALQFEQKPKKPLIETIKPRQVLQPKPKLIIKKEAIDLTSPVKPTNIVKPAQKFSARNLETSKKSADRPSTAKSVLKDS